MRLPKLINGTTLSPMQLNSMTQKTWRRIKDILSEKKKGQSVNIRGWIYRTRSSGNIVFLTLRDVTGILQVTIKKGNLSDKEFEESKKALIESSI